MFNGKFYKFVINWYRKEKKNEEVYVVWPCGLLQHNKSLNETQLQWNLYS